MNGYVFAVSVPPWVLFGAVAALAVVAGAAVLRLVEGGTDPRAGSAGAEEDLVCPRCRHRTPADATRCPECGKSL